VLFSFKTKCLEEIETKQTSLREKAATELSCFTLKISDAARTNSAQLFTKLLIRLRTSPPLLAFAVIVKQGLAIAEEDADVAPRQQTRKVLWGKLTTEEVHNTDSNRSLE
jgi:hypothetical protein